MAEDQQDDSQKTEDPTSKRLQEAREKGQVAKSQEINHWFVFLGLTAIIGIFGPGLTTGIGGALLIFLERPHAIILEGGGLERLIAGLAGQIALELMLPILVLVIFALLAGVAQSGINISGESLKPKLEKLSLLKGLGRIFSLRGLTEFAKGIAKLLIVTAVIGFVIYPERERVPTLVTVSLADLLGLMQELALKILIAVLFVMAIIAALDFTFQTFQHRKQLRMSRQDVKDEHKQSEGDPMVKARLRQLRMERARRRMMASVPEADVVIANPTHFAVALRYEAGTLGAPRVVAKGIDAVALRIRALAEQHDVPVVENPPLARALHEGVELDQEVPEEHYKAVAEIIGYVFRLKGKMNTLRSS